MSKYLRFPHFHAIFDECDSFPNEGVAFSNFPGINSLAFIIVDRFGTGRAQVWIVGSVVAHLRSQFI